MNRTLRPQAPLYRLFLLTLVSAALFACSSQATVIADEPPVAEAQPGNGTFTNTSGATLIVSGFEAEKGFAFKLDIVSDDECGGVSYSGTGTFTEPNTATSDLEDLFKFDGDHLHFEPSMEMIGMECAGLIDVEFVRQP